MSVQLTLSLTIIIQVLVITAPSSQATNITCHLDEWNLYKQRFAKFYPKHSDDLEHFSTFCNNLIKIHNHNIRNNVTYRKGLNQFSDLSMDELRKYTAIKPLSKPVETAVINSFNELRKQFNASSWIPEELDWSKQHGRVSEPQFQGDCGSCWAFVTVGLLEGLQKPSSSESLIKLSEQNLIDCDYKDSGCSGGNIDTALNEIRDNLGGLMPLSLYPYVSGQTGSKESCKMHYDEIVPHTEELGDTKYLKLADEQLLKETLATYGPVAANYYATDDFLYYSDGIFVDEDCPNESNHGLLIVGYGTDEKSGQDYWIVKNSWGPKWGQNGFGKVIRNYGNNCGIATQSIIVLPKSDVIKG